MLPLSMDKAMQKLPSRALLRRFGADDRGNVAMLTALAIIPLTVASLGAVDLTRGISARVELQDALDAAALAAGRSSSQDASELDRIGKRVLSQNLSGNDGLTVKSSSFKFGDDGRVLASAQASFSPMLGGLGGDGAISASTEVKRANSILEIAMVLDNTGSMDGTKIKNLRNTAAKFVEVMKKAADQSVEPKAVQIALVPFSNTVRVGATYRDATWMDQSGVSPINDEIFTTATGTQHANRFTLLSNLGTTWAGCVENRQAPYDVTAEPPATNEPATLFTPMFAPDEEDTDESGVNDYLNDPRDAKNKPLTNWWTAQGDIKKYAKSPKVTVNEKIGPNKGCDMQPIQRLTTDYASITTAISKMKAVGETNIPNGLLWGWLTLSPNAPFADGVAYLKPKHRKIVVLMTDGDNTMLENRNSNNKSTYSAAGFAWQGRLLDEDGDPLTDRYSSQSTRTAAFDSRLKLLCTNMKKADVGIEIYAVGVGVSENAKKLLKACASGEDHYFDVTGSDMTEAFQSVANQISQLHLAK
jgi:Flp pilus assembly protein TadG